MFRISQAAPQHCRSGCDAAATAPDSSCLRLRERTRLCEKPTNARQRRPSRQTTAPACATLTRSTCTTSTSRRRSAACARGSAKHGRRRACLQAFLHFCLQGAVQPSSNFVHTRHKQACWTCRVARLMQRYFVSRWRLTAARAAWRCVCCAKSLHGLLPAGLHLSPCTASGRRRVVTWNGDASLHVLRSH